MAALRAGVDADIARIAGVVRRGAGFFVTPEGFYSTDGRMRPLKGIVEHLVPIASTWLAAIAFDPFRGRRLSLLYRIVQPADPQRLAASLAAARPVTTSALLARWMLAARAAVHARGSARRRDARRDALPHGRVRRSGARARRRALRRRSRCACSRRAARSPRMPGATGSRTAAAIRASTTCTTSSRTKQRSSKRRSPHCCHPQPVVVTLSPPSP